MGARHPVNTSMKNGKVFDFNDCSCTVLSSERTAYPCLLREPIASLRYLVIWTRPDIAFANEEMAQIWKISTSLLWRAVKWIVWYITGKVKER